MLQDVFAGFFFLPIFKNPISKVHQHCYQSRKPKFQLSKKDLKSLYPLKSPTLGFTSLTFSGGMWSNLLASNLFGFTEI
jgi:hypothetical protein